MRLIEQQCTSDICTFTKSRRVEREKRRSWALDKSFARTMELLRQGSSCVEPERTTRSYFVGACRNRFAFVPERTFTKLML